MNYLENIGKNSKKAFENLKSVKHDKIKKVLESYNKSLLINKQKIIILFNINHFKTINYENKIRVRICFCFNNPLLM